MAQRPAVVYPILAVGLLSISFSPILVRFASEAPGFAIAAWRPVIAVALLAPFAVARARPEMRRLTRRDWGLIVLAGVLLGIHFIAWIESLYYTSVASASVLVTTSPIFLAVFGFLFLRERPTLRTILAIGVAVGGAALIGVGDAGETAAPEALLGNTLALTAALVVTFYLLIGRVVRQRAGWLAYVFPLYAVVAATTVGWALATGTPLLSYGWEFYALCSLMALGPQIAGHGSFNYALRYFPAATLGLLSLIEPVAASLMAYGFFGEIPTLVSAVGMLLVLVAVTAAMLPRQWVEGRIGPKRRAGRS